jgi:hypothetical protein
MKTEGNRNAVAGAQRGCTYIRVESQVASIDLRISIRQLCLKTFSGSLASEIETD